MRGVWGLAVGFVLASPVVAQTPDGPGGIPRPRPSQQRFVDQPQRPAPPAFVDGMNPDGPRGPRPQGRGMNPPGRGSGGPGEQARPRPVPYGAGVPYGVQPDVYVESGGGYGQPRSSLSIESEYGLSSRYVPRQGYYESPQGYYETPDYSAPPTPYSD